MTPLRLNILGASGCGASTLGRALAERLSIPYFDSDDYFHGPSDPPFRNPRPAQERATLIHEDLGSHENWVLGGGVAGWDPDPELGFTLIVFLWVPATIRLDRLRRREGTRFGNRILPGGDMNEDHKEFLEWASRYDAGDVEGKTLGRHEAYLAAQTIPVIEFREVLPTAHLVEAVVRRLNER